MNKVLTKRFNELEEQIAVVEATKYRRDTSLGVTSEYLDNETLLNWTVKVKNIFEKACGLDSQHFQHLCKAEEGDRWSTNYQTFKSMKAVFLAAKEDFEGGYLTSVKSLVQAELFDSELEQATELLKSGYKLAAAVVCGVVLETSLRELCNKNGLSIGNLNKMNADLSKAGVYNLLIQKKITALADIRNNAAHGKPEAFSETDVQEMIRDTERFLADYLVD